MCSTTLLIQKMSATNVSTGGKTKAQRIKGATLSYPIVYGNLAWHLGKQAIPFRKTHRWMCYFRGTQNEDLSFLIDHVVFTLHESFPNYIRPVRKQPFQVEETGWGEFGLQITVHFTDPQEKPLYITHHLRLLEVGPDGAPLVSGGINYTKKPLVSEFYDEIIFNDPTVAIFEALKAHPLPATTVVGRPLAHPLAGELSRFSAQLNASQDLQIIADASNRVRNEISRVSQHIEEMNNETHKLEEELKMFEASAQLNM